MSNLEVREFQMAIEEYVEKSKVPIEVKRLVLTNLLFKMEKSCNDELLKEIAQRDTEVTENAESV